MPARAVAHRESTDGEPEAGFFASFVVAFGRPWRRQGFFSGHGSMHAGATRGCHLVSARAEVLVVAMEIVARPFHVGDWEA